MHSKHGRRGVGIHPSTIDIRVPNGKASTPTPYSPSPLWGAKRLSPPLPRPPPQAAREPDASEERNIEPVERYFTGCRATLMDVGSLDVCQFAWVRIVIFSLNRWERSLGWRGIEGWYCQKSTQNPYSDKEAHVLCDRKICSICNYVIMDKGTKYRLTQAHNDSLAIFIFGKTGTIGLHCHPDLKKSKILIRLVLQFSCA